MIRKTMLAALMVVAVISVPAAFAATSQNAVNQLQNDVNNNRNGMSDSELQRFYERLDDYRADTTNNNLLRQLDNIEGILQSIGPRAATDDGTTDTYDHSVLEDAIAAINDTLTDIQNTIEDILFDISALKEDIGDLETEDETLDQKIDDEVEDLTYKVQSNWSSIDDIEDVTDDHETRIAELEALVATLTEEEEVEDTTLYGFEGTYLLTEFINFQCSNSFPREATAFPVELFTMELVDRNAIDSRDYKFTAYNSEGVLATGFGDNQRLDPTVTLDENDSYLNSNQHFDLVDDRALFALDFVNNQLIIDFGDENEFEECSSQTTTSLFSLAPGL